MMKTIVAIPETTKQEKGPFPFSRTNPFQARVLKNVNLNKIGSSKETMHIELSLKDSGLSYIPGDALGMIPSNDPELVGSLLEQMNWDPETEVMLNKQGDTLPLKEALTDYFEITLLSRKIVQQALSFTENEELKKLVENAEELKEYCNGRDLLDLLRDFGPWKASVQEIVSLLRKMTARLYSFSISLAANPDEVHLTIAAVRYNTHGRVRKGVCSTLVSERLQEGDTVPLFIQPNKHFHLPEEDQDIIMVGPGTGIAPFRSFIEERVVMKATESHGYSLETSM